MILRRIAILCAVGILGSVPTASASLIGVNASLELHYDLDAIGPGGTNFTGSAIVGAGEEFSVPICSDCATGNTAEGTFHVDLAADTITFSQTGSPFPDVLQFSMALTGLNDSLGPIIGVTPVAIGNPFTVSFTANSVMIVNPANFDPPSNFTNVYRLDFAPTAVPEPATMLLVGGGMLVGGIRRRSAARKQQTDPKTSDSAA